MSASFASTVARSAARAARISCPGRQVDRPKLVLLAAGPKSSTRLSSTYTSSSARDRSPAPREKQRRGLHRDGRDNWSAESKANNPEVGNKRFADFDLTGRVFLVTGGARGLGLNLAEALCEAGGKVYCLDRLPEADEQFYVAQHKAKHKYGAELHYAQVDVLDVLNLDKVISEIADSHGRLDGLIAAAGIQQITPAIDYKVEDINKMLGVNYTGVFLSATATARQMMKHKTRGSILLIGSMSGTVANKGLISPVYNSSKAAVIQLTRNLAMEWGKVKDDGSGGIRVNCLSPGHIVTPMVKKNFEEVPGLRELWEHENMLGRLADPAEFKGAALFMLSNASSFMTGTNLIIDGGHTAW